MTILKNPISLWLAIVLIAVMSALSGCASTGTQLDTFNKKVAAAYATMETIADVGNAALESGRLTPDQAKPTIKMLREAVDLIDLAEHIYATDPNLANDKLNAALVILTAIQSALALHGVK